MQPTGSVARPWARAFAFTGLILFGSSLLFFVYQYAVTFGRVAPGPISVRAIAEDIVLFSVFALHHSAFARDRFRRWMTRHARDLERSCYVWIASALFIVVCAWWRPVGGVAWQVDRQTTAMLMAGGQLVGVWLSLRSAFLIDVGELSGVKQVTNEPAHSPDRRLDSVPLGSTGAEGPEFKTSGPYGWVRHPIYAGWFLMVFCAPTMTMTRLVFAVTSSAYLLVAIPLEERSLRQSSRGAYDDYIRKVRWKLVPYLF